MEANLAQSLHLLNSEEIQKKLADEAGRAAALVADQSRDDSEKIHELYNFERSKNYYLGKYFVILCLNLLFLLESVTVTVTQLSFFSP